VDWETLEQRFDWLRTMDGVPQDPLHHAEGDVRIHTRMVAGALADMDEWRGLPSEERSLLFAAALLHDVAKPVCTTVEPDGRITSRQHPRKGETMARQILWRGEDLPSPDRFPQREATAALVRLHGLPLWFLEKPDPERAVIAASLRVRLDRLALLAEADVRGRECSDQQELLDRIELFRQFCRENRCYTGPREFPSDHSRFVYFRSEHGSPDYGAFDDTRFEVILMSGLPGAGKDTWIGQNRSDWPVVSLDQIRKELKVPPDANQALVIQTAKERARQHLGVHRSFIWNATNVTRSMRGQLIDFFASYPARIRIVYLDAPYALILRRNRSRLHSVPERIIDELARKLEVPDLTEAHTVEWVYEQG
jgi:predicted kinase